MFKTTSNKQSFEISFEDDTYSIDGQKVEFDALATSSTERHILFNNKSYNAEIIEVDYNKKIVVVEIQHKRYTVQVDDEFDMLLVKMGFDKGAQQKIDALRAPMPGLVISLQVKVGDSIEAGDALLVLEAMKMENVLPSPTSGIVAEILTAPGDKVEKNQVLIAFE